MKKRPVSVIIVSVLFILVGCIGFAYHVKELSGKQYETIWVLFMEISAVACGILLLFKISWARWLAIAWLLCHIIISAFNSTSEMIAHIVFLVIISTLLFLPASSRYFKVKAGTQKKNIMRVNWAIMQLIWQKNNDITQPHYSEKLR